MVQSAMASTAAPTKDLSDLALAALICRVQVVELGSAVIRLTQQSMPNLKVRGPEFAERFVPYSVVPHCWMQLQFDTDGVPCFATV